MKQICKLSIVAASALFMAGCGGGGGNSGGSSNVAPTANAGSDLTTTVNTALSISGSGSDSDGTIASYVWSEGSTQLSASTTSGTLSYTPTSIGTHTLTLTVTDDDGATATDTVDIVVNSTSLVTRPLLIVRVNFSDKTFTNDATTWSSKIFGTSNGQLNHYYNEISYGNFQFSKASETEGVNNDGIITVTLSSAHPGNDDPANGNYGILTVINQAIALADNDIDFSAYDTNNDNAISKDELQLMFLIAGGETSSGCSPASSVWAHAWSMFGSNAVAPTLDGVKLMDYSSGGGYSRFGERHCIGTEHDATIGIIAHELGHAALNLPDLYDADGNTGGIGDFGLMGGGSWGKTNAQPIEAYGATPAHMTGWSKMKSGFINPTVLAADTTGTTIDAASTSSYTLYQVNTGNPGEYFLIENRGASGYDMGLSTLGGLSGGAYTGGLSILHIDDNQLDNTDENHRLVGVNEANNPVLDLTSGSNSGHINNLYFAGNKDTLLEADTKQYDGTTTGIEVTNISGAGNSMTADIKVQ